MTRREWPIRRSKVGKAHNDIFKGYAREYWLEILMVLADTFNDEWFKWSAAIERCTIVEKRHLARLKASEWIEKKKKGWKPAGEWRLTLSALKLVKRVRESATIDTPTVVAPKRS